jgi:hypothetical protein
MSAPAFACNRYRAFLRININHMNLILKIAIGLIVLKFSLNTKYALGQNNNIDKNQLKNCVSNPDTLDGQFVYIDSISKAHFPGGVDALLQYITRNIKISSANTEWQGRVLVTFVIDKMGNTRNVCINNDVPVGVQSEVRKLIEHMPAWIPGTVKKKRVYTRIWLPLIIDLED